ncbi:hypothetical protein [Saccharothrix sp. HUAS TT1]|uniref:hypothetical protein n=1 Tax=unclassified Saccharothrix TaxID=2593673 RepID=UPI00345B5849
MTGTTVTIAPGLRLPRRMFDLAAQGVVDHAPELGPLREEDFFSSRWTLIPDESTGEAYKAELVLLRTPTRTIKLNRWFAPDLRDPAGPRPHNHPWDFHSTILDGLLVEDRWAVRDGQVLPDAGVEHAAGQVNRIGREEFHEVREVDPDRTLTLMICGPGMAGWGYLDPASGAVAKAVLPAGFDTRLRELNPHQR